MDLEAETEIACPHCGESFPLVVDTSQAEQSMIEDCTVCCRPIELTIRCRPGEILEVREEE
jgi:phage terminase large subunit GpA-like protein